MQASLTKLTFEAMKNIAKSPSYHPAVRYNAMLVIGMLDDKYAIPNGANQRPPKPSQVADNFLRQVVGAAVGDKAVPPSLVTGALVGLERHAQYRAGLDNESIADMTNIAMALATKNPPVADVDTKVAEWIRIQAATVLAKLGSTDPDGHGLDALVNVLADGKLTLDGRCEVAGLLGLTNYKDAKVDGKVAFEKLLQLAFDVGQASDKQAKAFQELSLGGGGGAAAMGRERGARVTYSSTGEPRNEYDRKTLLSRLGDLRKGLVAIKPIVPADRAATIDSVISAMQTVIDGAGNKDTADLDVADTVRKMFVAIQAAVKGSTATAAKPAGEPLIVF